MPEVRNFAGLWLKTRETGSRVNADWEEQVERERPKVLDGVRGQRYSEVPEKVGREGAQHSWRAAFTPLWERRDEETQPVPSRYSWSRHPGGSVG